MNNQAIQSGGNGHDERYLDPGPAWRHRLLIHATHCQALGHDAGSRVEQLLTTLIGAHTVDANRDGGDALKIFEERLDLGHGTCGFSLVQFFASTSIAGHYVERDGDVYIDVLSCVPMPVERAHRAVRQLFVPERVDVAFQSDTC
jgi:hypothetical protein